MKVHDHPQIVGHASIATVNDYQLEVVLRNVDLLTGVPTEDGLAQKFP